MTTKIAHILGDWGRNIGNAFFQLGGQYILKKVLPDARMMLIGEQPGYPSYWNPKGRNPQGFFDFPASVEVDYLVLMGPMFRKETMAVWGETFRKMSRKDTKLILLGVACMNYEQDSIESYRAFLKEFPPFIISSRDTETYRLLGDLAEHAYDGIDLAFFLPEVYQPVGFTNLNPLIALNFDKIPEPEITIEGKEHFFEESDDRFIKTFSYQEQHWQLTFPRFRQTMAEKSRYLMFLEGIIFQDNKVPILDKYHIVRTDHRPHPMIKRKTYRSSNVLVNDVPYPYLEVYNQAELTLSNRIHACVAALSYGNYAMLISQSPRIRMLERVGVDKITKYPVKIELSKLDLEKKNLEEFLRGVLS